MCFVLEILSEALMLKTVIKENKKSQYVFSLSKRCFDILVGLLVLFHALIIMIFAGFYIFVTEGPPIFFVHHRAGKGGRLFRLWKLRTLRKDADPYVPAYQFKQAGQITLSGKFLRRHRIDELPQLFSVLSGRMSLVGPRPEIPQILSKYKPEHAERLMVRPGVTGLWQLMGNRGIGIHQEMVYDEYYLYNACLWLDIKILVLTIMFILNPK